MAMEELELTDAQAQALLESPSPLADVYRYFEKLETGYMDVIRDSIESRANEVCREPEELNPMVVYLHSASVRRLSMEKQTHIGCLTRRIFPAKLPLSRRSVPTMETTDWIPLLRSRRSWRNSDRSE